MNTTTRSEKAGDAKAISRVIEDAFRNIPYASHTEHLIVDALRQSNLLTLSLVAEADDGTVVGYVAISPVTISTGDVGWYGLGPIAVAPEHQIQGIGTRLIKHGLQELQQLGAAGCVVLGEGVYYGRFGFTHDPELLLPGVRPGYFQILPFKDSVPKGTVAYSKAFEVRR